MPNDLMWQGIQDGYRRLAADEAESAVYRAEAAEWTGADLGRPDCEQGKPADFRRPGHGT